MTKKIVVISGGCNFYVRPHLALSAPAFGTTGYDLSGMMGSFFDLDSVGPDWVLEQYYTKMAGGAALTYADNQDIALDTNADVSALIDKLVADETVKVIFMPVAMCDFEVSHINMTDQYSGREEAVGKSLPRLKTAELDFNTWTLNLRPAPKIINKIRKTRKDIFLVGFKTTTDATEDEQFKAGLNLLKTASCNLVLANDLKTRLNMVITPEQAKYGVTTDRLAALTQLVRMTAARCQGVFTRSQVVDGTLVPWSSSEIPSNLREVVNYTLGRGAYRPFNGKTVGHFAVKVSDNQFLTSVRKTNFNDLVTDPEHNGLVKVETKDNNEVVAYGARPSVGGQSQRIVFANHPDTACIWHAHVQLRVDSQVPVQPQWPNECGSVGCGQTTSDGLKFFSDYGVWAVFLEKHGPNVVFNRNTPADKVIQFIEDNFILDHQTSELS